MSKMSFDQWKRNMQQAINKYNNDVKKYNSDVKRSIDKYNQEVRNYNNQVRSNRQKLTSALNTLKSRSTSSIIKVNYRTELHSSVQLLSNSYNVLESNYNSQNVYQNKRLLIDLPEKETTNSVMLYNSLMGNDEDDGQNESDLQRTVIEEQLYQTSPDLDKRWRGAIFSLNPNNPDAARHFCTSVREILIKVIDTKAPDNEVFNNFPNCQLISDGKPTRRSKINYLLSRKNLSLSTFESFVDNDVSDVIKILDVLNEGTHGEAGRFEIQQLLKLKKRVEESIMFLTTIV
jgi:hypothetical protein